MTRNTPNHCQLKMSKKPTAYATLLPTTALSDPSCSTTNDASHYSSTATFPVPSLTTYVLNAVARQLTPQPDEHMSTILANELNM